MSGAKMYGLYNPEVPAPKSKAALVVVSVGCPLELVAVDILGLLP